MKNKEIFNSIVFDDFTTYNQQNVEPIGPSIIIGLTYQLDFRKKQPRKSDCLQIALTANMVKFLVGWTLTLAIHFIPGIKNDISERVYRTQEGTPL